METKHTGPPWGVRIGTTHNIIAAQGDIICVVERKTVSRLEEEQDANSHLMADAPTLQARIDRLEAEKAELVGALEDFVCSEWMVTHTENGDWEQVMNKARAALAKAQP